MMANASTPSSLDQGDDIGSNVTYNDECCLKTALAFVVLRQRLTAERNKEKSNGTDSSDQVTKETLPFLSNILGRQDSKASTTTTRTAVSLSKPISTSSSMSSMLPPSAGNHHLQRMMRVAIATAMPLYKEKNNHDHLITDTSSTRSKSATTGTSMSEMSAGVPTDVTPPSQNKIDETSRKRYHETKGKQEQSPYCYQNHHGWVYDYKRAAATTNLHDVSIIYTTLEGLTSHLAQQLRRIIANNNNRNEIPTTSKERQIPSSSSLQTWIRNTFISTSWENASNRVPTRTNADKSMDGTATAHSTFQNSQTSKLQQVAKSKHYDNDDTTTTHENNNAVGTSQTMKKNSPVRSSCETITISPDSILTMCTIWHGILRDENDATGKLTFLVMKVVGQLLQDLYNDLFQYNANASHAGNQSELPTSSRMPFSCNNHKCTRGGATPRIADVLTVNLIHLLEGIVSWRFQQKQTQHQHYNDYDRGQTSHATTTTTAAAAAAQEELIVELQNTLGSEIWMPISVQDMAHFYYTQHRQHQQRQHQQYKDYHQHLTPSGKIMLRLSLYDIMQKLSTSCNY